MGKISGSLKLKGYFVAVFYSSVCAMVVFAVVFLINPLPASVHPIFRAIPSLMIITFFLGGFLTLLTAGPGFFVIVYGLEKLNLHSLRVYMFGGGLNSIFASLIFDAFDGGLSIPNLNESALFVIIPGVCGGWGYHRYRQHMLAKSENKEPVLQLAAPQTTSEIQS